MALPLDRRLEKATSPLFAPLGLGVVLHLEQLDHEEFISDAALASFSLRSAVDVMEADAIAVSFDSWAEAEAAGRNVVRAADGRMTEVGEPLTTPVTPTSVIEAAPVERTATLTRRISEELGESASVLATICGPATLLARIYGADRSEDLVEAATQLAAKTVGALCDTGIAAIVMLEDEPADPKLFARFDATFNLARYYQVPVLYLSRTTLSAVAGRAARAAGVTWAVGPGDADGPVAAIPMDAFTQDSDFAAGWKAGLGDAIKLFVTAWEIPAETGAETILRVRKTLVG